MLIFMLLAGFAAGAFGLDVVVWPPFNTGSWQQTEIRWQGDPTWQLAELQGQATVTHTQHGDFQILTLLAATGEIAHIHVTIEDVTLEFWLFCDEELQAALTQAHEILLNPGRHNASYIAQLRAAVAHAESFYATAEICPEEFTSTVEQLQQLTGSPQSIIVGGGFVGRFVPAWWSILDTVTAPLRRMTRTEMILPLLGRIVSAVFARN